YTCRDVLVAAAFWGELPQLEVEAQQGLACRAREQMEGDPLPENAVDAAEVEFRYARDLLTGDAMQEWLDGWDFTIEAWRETLRRALLRAQWSGELGALVSRHAPAPLDDDDALAVLLHEALCSERLARWAQALAARAAVHDLDVNPDRPDSTGN